MAELIEVLNTARDDESEKEIPDEMTVKLDLFELHLIKDALRSAVLGSSKYFEAREMMLLEMELGKVEELAREKARYKD